VSFECFYHEKLRANVVTMHNAFNARDCLSVAESAICFGVSDTNVHRLIYAGKLKVITGFGRLAGLVFDDEKSACEHGAFPYSLEAPIVHIERSAPEIESAIEARVEIFGGEFAGTRYSEPIKNVRDIVPFPPTGRAKSTASWAEVGRLDEQTRKLSSEISALTKKRSRLLLRRKQIADYISYRRGFQA
jgi:hypothetical protein